MRLIPLTQGKSVQVDDWNYHWLNQWKWHAIKARNTYYAARYTKRIDGKREYILMHRLIMNTPSGLEVDHQDHNGLNCQEFNMRNSTYSQNNQNKTASGEVKYLGVSKRSDFQKAKLKSGEIKVFKNKPRYKAFIMHEGKSKYLGNFETDRDAAIAYNNAALELHGEYASLNIIN